MTLTGMRVTRLAAASVPASFVFANALSYALLLAAAHRMASADYGELSSLLGLLLVATIPMLALQTVAARRTAVHDDPHHSHGVPGATLWVALACTVLLLAMSPVLAGFLHLHGVLGVVLVAVAIPPLAVIGSASGVAQGRRRFHRLAVLIAAGTGGRALGGLIAVLLFATPDATLAGIAVGAVIVACGTLAGDAGALHDADRAQTRATIIETAHAGHMHGVFLLLTSLDVLLARHVLTSSQAGVYAVGAVLTRAALWLPQSVVLLLFASLAQQASRRLASRRAALVTVGFGVLGVAATAALGPVVVLAVGGARYHRLDSVIWLWTLLGALLSIVQLAVLVGLARQSRRRAALPWAMLLVDLVVVLGFGVADTPQQLVVTLVCVAALAAVVSLWLVLREPPAPFDAPADPVTGG